MQSAQQSGMEVSQRITSMFKPALAFVSVVGLKNVKTFLIYENVVKIGTEITCDVRLPAPKNAKLKTYLELSCSKDNKASIKNISDDMLFIGVHLPNQRLHLLPGSSRELRSLESVSVANCVLRIDFDAVKEFQRMADMSADMYLKEKTKVEALQRRLCLLESRLAEVTNANNVGLAISASDIASNKNDNNTDCNVALSTKSNKSCFKAPIPKQSNTSEQGKQREAETITKTKTKTEQPKPLSASATSSSKSKPPTKSKQTTSKQTTSKATTSKQTASKATTSKTTKNTKGASTSTAKKGKKRKHGEISEANVLDTETSRRSSRSRSSSNSPSHVRVTTNTQLKRKSKLASETKSSTIEKRGRPAKRRKINDSESTSSIATRSTRSTASPKKRLSIESDSTLKSKVTRNSTKGKAERTTRSSRNSSATQSKKKERKNVSQPTKRRAISSSNTPGRATRNSGRHNIIDELEDCAALGSCAREPPAKQSSFRQTLLLARKAEELRKLQKKQKRKEKQLNEKNQICTDNDDQNETQVEQQTELTERASSSEEINTDAQPLSPVQMGSSVNNSSVDMNKGDHEKMATSATKPLQKAIVTNEQEPSSESSNASLAEANCNSARDVVEEVYTDTEASTSEMDVEADIPTEDETDQSNSNMSEVENDNNATSKVVAKTEMPSPERERDIDCTRKLQHNDDEAAGGEHVQHKENSSQVANCSANLQFGLQDIDAQCKVKPGLQDVDAQCKVKPVETNALSNSFSVSV